MWKTEPLENDPTDATVSRMVANKPSYQGTRMHKMCH